MFPSCLGLVLHGWMTLNGRLKVKMGVVEAGTTGHELMMVAVEAVAMMGSVDVMHIWGDFFRGRQWWWLVERGGGF